MITLNKFCVGGSKNHRCANPWRVNGFVYATNGYACVRIDQSNLVDSAVDGTPSHPDIDKILAPICNVKNWYEIPTFDICQSCENTGCAKVECETCDGNGKITQSCAACDTLIGNRKIRRPYIVAMKEMPDCTWGCVDENAINGIVFFKFAGGVGAVMAITQVGRDGKR